MSIEISRETEARIEDEARRRGLSVDALLERLMNDAAMAKADTRSAPRSCPFCISERRDLSTGGTSTTMSAKPGMVDANVLIYSVNVDAPQL